MTIAAIGHMTHIISIICSWSAQCCNDIFIHVGISGIHALNMPQSPYGPFLNKNNYDMNCIENSMTRLNHVT